MAATIKFWDAYTSPATDGGYSLGSLALQFNNLYITGLAYIDGIGEDLLVDSTFSIQFRDSGISINSATDGHLDLTADVSIDLNAPTYIQTLTGILRADSGLITVDTTLGTTYLKVDTSNDPLTGNLEISKVDPELRLTDTGNSEYTRITRTDTANVVTRYNRVNKPGSLVNALSLDGSSYVVVDDDNTLDLTTKGSWEAWIYIDPTAAASNECILSKWNVSNTGAYAFMNGNDTDFRVRLIVWNAGEGYSILASNTNIGTGAWHYVVATYDGVVGEMKVYLDSVIDGTKSSGVISTMTSSSDVIHIGDYQAYGIMFKGYLQEVRIYNKVLSQVDIDAHWNAGAGEYGSAETGLVAGWHMSESALPLADFSGNGNVSSGSYGTPTFVPGKITTAGAIEESVVWKSQDGADPGEAGIQTFGDVDGETVIAGKTLDLATAVDTDLVVNFKGTSNSGIMTWMEDEDYLKFSDDLLINSTEMVQFRDTAIAIASDTDGHLDLDADISIDFQIGTTEQIVLTNGKLAPTADDDIDLGDSTHEYKDIYSDGTLYTDGRILNVVTKTSGYTATVDDDVIICNSTTAFTILLPVASGSGRRFVIKNINTGTITIDGDSSDKIDGVTTQTLPQWSCAQIEDNAVNTWVVI